MIVHSDALAWLSGQPDNSVDFILFSPPYENARQYEELKFSLAGEAFLDWLKPILKQCVRVSPITCCVINGKTRDFEYSCVPEKLVADLSREGITFRKSQLFARYGICGKTDYLKDNYEFILTMTQGGRLPFCNFEEISEAPKYAPGGNMSNRQKDGKRVKSRPYKPPLKANCGNIHWGSVGKTHMGHPIAHENEAPFPLWLAERLVTCFCPPDGIVVDVMAGSGTTLEAAKNLGRRYIGLDIRESQVKLMQERLTT